MELVTLDSGLQNKIGIIGFGFLGTALAHGFSNCTEIKIYDKYSGVYNDLYETVNDSDFIFIGVPTPMMDDGSQDLSSMDDAVENVVNAATSKKIIILRSTMIPGTTRKYAEEYTKHEFVFFPEFLSERTSKLDFINPTRIILGGDEAVWDVEELFRMRFPHTPIYVTTWEAAEVAKYMANCFSAVKLSFMNELYDIAQHLEVDYDELRNMALLASGWVGNMHVSVPGPDGERGYGGKCLPKDIQAFINWAKEKDLRLDMCEAAEKVNDRVREYKNWLDIKGATSKNNYGDEEN